MSAYRTAGRAVDVCVRSESCQSCSRCVRSRRVLYMRVHAYRTCAVAAPPQATRRNNPTPPAHRPRPSKLNPTHLHYATQAVQAASDLMLDFTDRSWFVRVMIAPRIAEDAEHVHKCVVHNTVTVRSMSSRHRYLMYFGQGRAYMHGHSCLSALHSH